MSARPSGTGSATVHRPRRPGRPHSGAPLALAALALAACAGDPVRPDRAAPDALPRPSLAVVAGVTPTDLGALPGGVSALAFAVNAAGYVAGGSGLTVPASERYHATRWTAPGAPHDLGTLGTTAEIDFSEARGINAHGHVVGISSTASGGEHAFLWTPGEGMQDLGTLPGGDRSFATAVDEYGRVVGESSVPVGDVVETHAFLWTAETGMTDLGTLGGTWSRANAINDRAQVVGQSAPTGGGQRAFLWTAADDMQDLGTLGGPSSVANAINDGGQVAGRSATGAGPEHAFLWTAEGGMRDLGVLPGDVNSVAYGINAHGQVVGLSSGTTGHDRAFLWTADEGMRELPGLGGEDSEARAINDRGDVAGTSELPPHAAHAERAVLWTTWIPVPVDVRPEVVRLNASGQLRAAVLTTPALDARVVAPESATLGDEMGGDTPVARRRDGSVVTSLTDADGDGDVDRVLHFALAELRDNGDVGAWTTRLVLRARLADGRSVRGTARIKVVGARDSELP